MHLPIRVVGRPQPVEVPFQLQPSFKFAVHIPGHGIQEFVAELNSRDAMRAEVHGVEHRCDLLSHWVDGLGVVRRNVTSEAEAILSAVLTRLGLVEVDGERRAAHGPDALTWIGLAHQAEKRVAEACKAALVHLTPVWRDRTDPAPKPHVAADILDSYYQQVMDEVLGEWEDKAQREAADYLTGRASGSHSGVAP